MYAIHRLRKHYKVACFEAGDGVGGTWYWNRYPGARVDVESVQYSYGFDNDLQQEWNWSEHSSAQPDLERYANHVADRFNLCEFIRLSNPVRSMRFDETENRWHVQSAKGDHVACRYVIAATGPLYASHKPEWPGQEEFKGRVLHTTEWPREGIDFAAGFAPNPAPTCQFGVQWQQYRRQGEQVHGLCRRLQSLYPGLCGRRGRGLSRLLQAMKKGR